MSTPEPAPSDSTIETDPQTTASLETWNRFAANHRRLSPRQWDRQLVMLLASAAVIAYLSYRFFWTFNLVTPFSTFLSVGLWIAEMWMGLMLFLYFFQVWKLEEPPLKKPLPGRSVDVLIATYNEPVEILRETISSCNEMDYPHETYLLDDGNREEMRQLAEELGIHYITRPEHDHAKAGNLNHALPQTHGEFIVVLDADHVPFRHLIHRMIGYFDDPKMAYVQSPHSAYNFDNISGDWSPETHQYWEDVNLFHYTVQLGKNHWNAACFCGSAAMFRRSALDSINHFATETITEDLHTGMRLAAKGWKSLAVSEPLIVGQAPEDIHSLNVQRVRWGQGNLSVLHFDNPLTMRGLTFAQRLNYFGAVFNWTMGIPLAFTFFLPMFVLISNVPPVREATSVYLILLAAYLGSFLFAMEYVSGKAASLIGIQITLMSNYYTQIKSTFKAFCTKKCPLFIVTPKTAKQKTVQTHGWKVFKAIVPQLTIIVAGMIAIFWAGLNLVFGLVDNFAGFIAGSLVTLFFSWLALMAIAKSVRCYRRKRLWHYPAVFPVTFRKNSESEAEPSYGVSSFFNDSAMEWISSARLEVGDSVKLELTSPIKTVVFDVVITDVFDVREKKCESRGWFYRAELQNPTEEQLTDHWGIALKYVVPIILEQNYCTGEKQLLCGLIQSAGPLERWERFCHHPMRIPFMVILDEKAACNKVILEHYDSQSFQFVLPERYPDRERVIFDIMLDEPVHCSMPARGEEEIHIGGNTFYRYTFFTSDLEKTASEKIGTFYRHAKTNRWEHAIEKIRKQKSVLYNKKYILAGVLATVLVLGFVGAVYRYDNNDDIFMKHTALFNVVPSNLEATRERLQRILVEMDSLHENDLNRWLRLYEAAIRIRDREICAKAADAIAQIYEDHEAPAKAAEWKMVAAVMYFRLANRQNEAVLQLNDIRLTSGEKLLTPEKRYEYYIMRAQQAADQHDIKTMERFFREALYLNPENKDFLDEWLGGLLTMKKKYHEIRNSETPSDRSWMEDYERVTEEFQAMVRALPQNHVLVSQSAMLSEATEQNIPEAIASLETVASENALNHDDQTRLIRLLIHEKRYQETLPAIKTLDLQEPDSKEFRHLFTWAILPLAKELTTEDTTWAKNRMESLLHEASTEDYQGWTEEDYLTTKDFLHAYEMLDRHEAFLRAALKHIPPESLETRNELNLNLAMVLRDLKRYEEAESLLEGLLQEK